jgi:hypothetical protein
LAEAFVFREWCKELRTHKNIRILCSDWTAFELAFEDLVTTKAAEVAIDDEEAKAALEVEDA